MVEKVRVRGVETAWRRLFPPRKRSLKTVGRMAVR